VRVIHHTGAHGQRYDVNPANAQRVHKLLADGRRKIRAHILKQGVKDALLQQFDKDKYVLEAASARSRRIPWF